MPETLGVAEAKRRFSELIDRVKSGDRIIVYRRGKPALALVPAEEGDVSAQEKPVGLAAVAGALADWAELEDFVTQVYRARRRAKDRPVPGIG
jgi:prevent-host-death family protein